MPRGCIEQDKRAHRQGGRHAQVRARGADNLTVESGFHYEAVQVVLPHEWMHGHQYMRPCERRIESDVGEVRPVRWQRAAAAMMALARHSEPIQREFRLKLRRVVGKVGGGKAKLGPRGGVVRMVEESRDAVVVQHALVPGRQGMAGCAGGLREPARALGHRCCAMLDGHTAFVVVGGEQARFVDRKVAGKRRQDGVDVMHRGECARLFAQQRQAAQAPFLHVAGGRHRDPQRGGAKMGHPQPLLVAMEAMCRGGRYGVGAMQFATAGAGANVFAQQGVDDTDADVGSIGLRRRGCESSLVWQAGRHCAISHASLLQSSSTAAARPLVSGPLPRSTPR